MVLDLDVDSSTILYAFGVLFGIATLLYFSREIILNLSPTVKSFLLLGGFAALLLGGLHLQHRTLQKAMYVLSSVSYLAFLAYTIGVFGFSTEEVFLALGLSSALFIGLGYLIRDRGAEIPRTTVRNALIGIVAVGLLLAALDVAGPHPAYETSFADEVDADVSGPVTLGTVTVENGFILSRSVDMPRYRACIYMPERQPVFVSAENTPSLLSGGSSIAVNLTADIPVRRVNDSMEEPGLGSIPVEKLESCPDGPDEEKIVVTEETNLHGRIEIAR